MLLLVKTVVEGILVYQFFIVHIPKAKFPRNLGMGMGMGMGTGTGMPLFEKGYLGVSRVLYIYICHGHIMHAYKLLQKLGIMIHNYKFNDYLNNEHSN